MIQFRIAPNRGACLVTLILLCTAFAACGSIETRWGDLVLSPGEPIRLGAAIDGDASTPSALSPRSGNLTSPAVSGYRIETVGIPVHCQSSNPASIVEASALDGLAGFLGGGCSAGCVYAEPELFDRHTTMLAYGCTAGAVVDQGFSTVFRIAWDDNDQGVVAADYARSDLHAERVVSIHDTTVYGRALSEAFLNRFRGPGRTATEIEFPTGATVNLDSIGARVRAAHAQGAFLAIDREGAADVFAVLQQGLAPVPLIASDTVLGGHGSAASPEGPPEGLIAVGLARLNGSWTSEMDQRVDSEHLFDAQWNDAFDLYAVALSRVARTGSNGSLVIPRKRLRDALASSKFQGRTGRISFESNGDRQHDVGAAVYVVSGGKAKRLRQLQHGD
jgi:ABC-type branched-subunit amino acid transport system substrate-binding protein